MRRLTKFSLIGLPAIVGVAFLYSACGGDSSGANVTNSIAPLSGIFSPTTTSDSRRRGEVTLRGGFELFGASTGCGDGKDLATQLTEIADAAKLENLASTATSLANFAEATSFRPSCYGPTWTDNATGSSSNRHSGDLGIVYASASDTDNTACVACQVNALISSGPGLGNRLIKVVALGVAALGSAGKSLPAIGATEDVAASLPAITGITFTTFTIARLDDRDGHAVYKTDVAFTNSAGKTGTVTLYHEAIASDNSEFKGILYADLPYSPTTGSGTHRGISFVYHYEDSIYKFSYRTAGNRATDSADFFNSTTKVIDFSKSACGEDMHYILGYFDNANNGGTLHYAWQAGDGDGATRTFAVDVPNAAKGSRNGTGYAGYGSTMSSIAASGVPWTTKFHCNWLNALGRGPSVNFVQMQTMSDSSGDFVATANAINFAPDNDCNNASWTVSAAEASFLNGARSTAAHDMVAAPAASAFTYNFATAGNEPSFTIP